MNIIETPIQGAYVIETKRMHDERGFFSRMFCNNELKKMGLDFPVAQCNLSHSIKAGTLRGMHYQKAPHAEIKLITCIKGAFFDAIADVRKESPTYGNTFSLELSEENGKILYIPPYVAHGFQTLVDDTIAYYTLGEFFVPDAYGYLRWDDPSFDINWPECDNRIISSKDLDIPDFEF